MMRAENERALSASPAVLIPVDDGDTGSAFNRVPRPVTTLPEDEIELKSPPSPPSPSFSTQLVSVFLPILTAGTLAVATLARGGSLWFVVPTLCVSAIGVGLGVHNFFRQRRLHAEALSAHERMCELAVGAYTDQAESLGCLLRARLDTNDPDLPALLRVAQGERLPTGVQQPLTRLYERRRADPDFLRLRIGRGPRRASYTVKAPAYSPYEDSKTLRQLRELAARHQIIADVPLTAPFPELGSIGIAGQREATAALARALIWQLVVHHSPKDVRLAVFWHSQDDDQWEWLRWLPHTRALNGEDDYRLLARYDGKPEHIRQVIDALGRELQQRVDQGADGTDRPHIVVVVNEYDRFGGDYGLIAQVIRSGRTLGFSAICLVPEARSVPSECGAYIDLISDPSWVVAGVGGSRVAFTPDRAELKASQQLAQALAPVTELERDGRRDLPRNISLPLLFGIRDIRTYDPDLLWATVPEDSWAPVPCGLAGFDEPLLINLNEGIHGTHGMIAGTTGSGKSEFLLTLLLALAIRHSPDRVIFMLVDFKGGATFADLAALPHTVGVVTDLMGFMAERALIALNSELDRRKQTFARAGVPNIRAYRARGFEQRLGFGPMPNMIVAIDETDEMLRDFPEFVSELIRVAKQGRALGVHLVFATQQPSLIKEGLLRNLTYRVVLRVTDPADSKAMVGLPDAAYITPEMPGRAIFGAGKFVREFQSARVTLPYQAPSEAFETITLDVTGRPEVQTSYNLGAHRLQERLASLFSPPPEPLPGTIQFLCDELLRTYLSLEEQGLMPSSTQFRRSPETVRRQIGVLFAGYLRAIHEPEAAAGEGGHHTLPQLVGQLQTQMQGERAEDQEITLVINSMLARRGARYAAERYRVWTPPLTTEISLHELLSRQTGEPRWLQAPIGLLDLPAQAEQVPLILDLAGRDGSLLVLGSAGAGKTTLLRSLILALTATHSPADLWVYVVDPGGQACGLAMQPIEGRPADTPPRLPHLADAIAANDTTKVERLMLELQGQIDSRKRLLNTYGVDTLAQYRERAAAQTDLPPPPPGILIAIDHFAELAVAVPEAVEALKALVRDGRSCGLHFAVTGYSWKDVSAIQSNFETRIALRLNDPADSDALIGKAFAARIKAEQPGRAFVRTSERPTEAQIALPALHGPADAQGAEQPVAADLERAVREVIRRYPSSQSRLPRPLQALPIVVRLPDLLALSSATTIPFALDNLSLQPLHFDLVDATPHLLIGGGPRTGKSELIRSLLKGISGHYAPEALQLLLIDYRRRTLEPFTRLPHVRELTLNVAVGSGTAATREERRLQLIRSEAETRALAEHLTEELRGRSASDHWDRRLVLVINDWDLLQGTEVAALNALAPFVLQGRDLGFHVIVAGTELSNLGTSQFLKMLRIERSAVHLGTPSENSSLAMNLGMKLPRQAANLDMPPGRGYVLLQGQLYLAQCALSQ